MKLLSTLIIAACFVSQAVAQCPNGIRERKEIRTLSTDEWNAFVTAVKKSMSGTAPTPYDRMVKVHIDNKSTVHNVATFFTWHRYYIREFEKLLQTYNPNVMLPYWNWAFDSQAPEKSIVFRADRFGGNGRSGGCVTDGAFGGWKPAYPTPHCLQRQFDAGNRINSFYSSDVITRTIAQAQSYDGLRRAIEFAPHGSVHVGIGGDMALMQSPNDPIFWLHHAYIDKIYARWQTIQSGFATNYGGTNVGGSRAAPNDQLPGYNARVRDVFDTRALCYTYAELPAANTGGTRPPPTGVQQQQPAVTQQPRPSATQQQSVTTTIRATSSRVTGFPHLQRRGTEDKGKKSAPIDTNVGVPGDDRSNLVALRIPAPLPKSWLEMNNNLPEPEVRDHETKYAKVTDDINSIDGYIPPCALWMREDMLDQLKGEVDKFYGTIHGKYVETKTTSSISILKDAVRKQCGGSVRVEVDDYKDALVRIIGAAALPPPDAASYPFTKPGTKEKVKAFIKDLFD